jgi:hypothetical protein
LSITIKLLDGFIAKDNNIQSSSTISLPKEHWMKRLWRYFVVKKGLKKTYTVV